MLPRVGLGAELDFKMVFFIGAGCLVTAFIQDTDYHFNLTTKTNFFQLSDAKKQDRATRKNS